MAQGLFASLLIGTIIKTIGQQCGVAALVEIGDYAAQVQGVAMAIAIGYALRSAPPLVLFSLSTVGFAASALGGAGGPLAVLLITIVAAELGKAVSKETKIDILVTPAVTILSGVLLAMWCAPYIGQAASGRWRGDYVGNGAAAVRNGHFGLRHRRRSADASDQQRGNLRGIGADRPGGRRGAGGLLCADGWLCLA